MMATHETYLESDNDHPIPSNRKFGVTVGGVLAGMGAVRWMLGQGGVFGVVLATVGLLLVALGATVPGALAPLNRAWMILGSLLARITSPVVMLLMYLLVFTPIAIGMRLAGRDLLGLRRKAADESYWKMRPKTPHDANLLRMQF